MDGLWEAAAFQRERRIIADQEAKSDIYICADDDCLPESEPFIQKALAIMGRHPDYGILSLWPSNEHIHPWTPPDEEKPLLVSGVAHHDTEVMEHVSVGGIRFCRKGVMGEWPALEGRGYDGTHCMALRKAGYRAGYFLDILMTHVGKSYSTVWR